LDWVLTLPESLANEFKADLERFERENQMPYVTSIERQAEERGVHQGLLRAIKLSLETKFGEEGLSLLEEISQIQNLDTLQEIQVSLLQDKTLEEIRQLY
jgi:hypothetical protein